MDHDFDFDGATSTLASVILARLLRVLSTLLLGAAVLAGAVTAARAERVKDLVSIQGVRVNQLIGYGIVVGLDGTGDQTTQTPFTVQSIASMLSQLGVNLPPGTNLQLKNAAAVVVTATLPAFARPGQTIDVTVSSIGNAKSPPGRSARYSPANTAGRSPGRKCPSAPKLTARSKRSASGSARTSARTQEAPGCALRAWASMPALKSTPVIRPRHRGSSTSNPAPVPQHTSRP